MESCTSELTLRPPKEVKTNLAPKEQGKNDGHAIDGTDRETNRIVLAGPFLRQGKLKNRDHIGSVRFVRKKGSGGHFEKEIEGQEEEDQVGGPGGKEWRELAYAAHGFG
jgi:hypothetical protein